MASASTAMAGLAGRGHLDRVGFRKDRSGTLARRSTERLYWKHIVSIDFDFMDDGSLGGGHAQAIPSAAVKLSAVTRAGNPGPL